MINMVTHMGEIRFSQQYFSCLLGHIVSSCFGVSGMAADKNSNAGKSVAVSGDSAGIDIELHITVTYGLNIKAIARSIEQKIRYAVEDTTGITVNDVNIYVDSVKSE